MKTQSFAPIRGHLASPVRTEQELRELVQALQRPDAFPHPVQTFQVFETHISIVLTTGQYAYKLKKPVNFGFLNFSTRPLRFHYLQRELRLNRRLAPELYLDVLPVGGSLSRPAINRKPVIEWALRMRQFDPSLIFAELLQKNSLTLEHFRDLGIRLGEFHQRLRPVSPVSPLGSEPLIARYVWQNFEQIPEFYPGTFPPEEQERLHFLYRITRQWHQELEPFFHLRKSRGFIKLCHGDLHTRNIVLYQNQPLVFDCIEFNDELACIDQINDMAFLWMDLDFRNASPFAWQTINWWLAITGDYDGVKLFNYYRLYRALVRAKIALLQHQMNDYEQYMRLALQYARKPDSIPSVVLMCGPSGSGKSTLAERLSASLGMFWIRSDVERKRLARQPVFQPAQNPENLYSASMNIKTYERLQKIALTLLRAGYPVILDATFLRKEHRQRMIQALQQNGFSRIFIIGFLLSQEEILRRIRSRTESPAPQPSDASEEIALRHLGMYEPPGPDEGVPVFQITTEKVSPDELVQKVQDWFRNYDAEPKN